MIGLFVLVPEVIPVTTSDPRMIKQATPPTPAHSPVPTNADPQATLLALLTQAAKAAGVPALG